MEMALARVDDKSRNFVTFWIFYNIYSRVIFFSRQEESSRENGTEQSRFEYFELPKKKKWITRSWRASALIIAISE